MTRWDIDIGITNPPTNDWAGLPGGAAGAKLRFVEGGTGGAAQTSQTQVQDEAACKDRTFLGNEWIGCNVFGVNNTWCGDGGVAFTSLVNNQGTLRLDMTDTDDFQLYPQMGGVFKICYTNDGQGFSGTPSTANVNLMPSSARVAGVWDKTCTSPDCLRDHKAFHCFSLRKSYSNSANLFKEMLSDNRPDSCTITFGYYTTSAEDDSYTMGDTAAAIDMGIELPNAGDGFGTRTTWSAEYEYDGTRKACGTTPHDALCRDGSACSVGKYALDIENTNWREWKMPPVRDDRDTAEFKPFSVSACYCLGWPG